MGRIVKNILLALLLVVSFGTSSARAEITASDFKSTSLEHEGIKFYTDDRLIVSAYEALIDKKKIDELRLSDHSHSNDEMREKIDEYFESHGCELAGTGDIFVDAGLDSKVDPYFLAAISIIESTGGNHCVREHNAWGRKAGGANGNKYNRISANGWCTWNSWDDAIHDEADYISRVYLDQGRTTVLSIARKYCPPTSSTWRSNVSRVQNEIADL